MKVSNTIYLEIMDSMEKKKRFRSKIHDLIGQQIFIDYPIDEETLKTRSFIEGDKFKVWFLGKDEAVYSFKTEVIGKVERKFPMLILKDPGKDEYKRIQRRQYVRIDTFIDVAIQPIEQIFQPFTSTSIDISAGGMAVSLPDNHPMTEKDEVVLWFPLNLQSSDMIYIKVKAKLVRIILSEGRLKGSFQFIELDEKMRQKIVRYCFEKQLSLRKKERGAML
ncbi:MULTISPECIES: flagellar brake protein [Bacillaceae]|nr:MULTISPECIES: flagellar brake domain-containing protein [Bacillaceae]